MIQGNAPVFVKINDYEEVIATLENIRKKVSEARGILAKLNELKSEEDRELLAWSENLDDINSRVNQIDKNLLQ